MTADTLVAASAATIRAGSQSFAAASRLFAPAARTGAHLLYAWCRHCDDAVDGQTLGRTAVSGSPADVGARRACVAALDARTRAALAGDPPGDDAFRGLQRVVATHRIDPRWPIEHVAGFAMDVEPRIYPDLEALLLYCWRVAGVVGVMMAAVMGVDPDDLATLRRAQDLGLAFQLTNIARDVGEDARAGRLYLPVDRLARHGAAADPALMATSAGRAAAAAAASELVREAEPYYASALGGLHALSWRSAWAVATARGVYRRIGHDVVRRGEAALDHRVSTSDVTKLALAAAALAPTLTSRRGSHPARPAGLWSAI